MQDPLHNNESEDFMTEQAIADRNAAATRGIVTDFASRDLSLITLGTSAHSVTNEQTLLLGTEEFRVILKISGTRTPFEIRVLVGDKQLYWASLYGEHGLHMLLDSVVDGCQKRSIDPIQRYFKTTEDRPLAEITVDFLLRESRVYQDHLCQALQYRDVEIGTHQEFCSRLSSQRYGDLDQTRPKWAYMKQSSIGEHDVPVSKVLGTSSCNHSWLLEDDRGKAYLHAMAIAMKDGTLLPYLIEEPIQLFKHGETFWVASNGRHRVASIKGMLASSQLTIRAHVIELVEP